VSGNELSQLRLRSNNPYRRCAGDLCSGYREYGGGSPDDRGGSALEVFGRQGQVFWLCGHERHALLLWKQADPRPAAITAAPGATAVTYIPMIHLNQHNTYLLESCEAVIKLAICQLQLHACTRNAQGITDRGPTDHVDGDSAAPRRVSAPSKKPRPPARPPTPCRAAATPSRRC